MCRFLGNDIALWRNRRKVTCLWGTEGDDADQVELRVRSAALGLL